MTEILALQELELQTEEETEPSAFPCFSIYASTITESWY